MYIGVAGTAMAQMALYGIAILQDHRPVPMGGMRLFLLGERYCRGRVLRLLPFGTDRLERVDRVLAAGGRLVRLDTDDEVDHAAREPRRIGRRGLRSTVIILTITCDTNNLKTRSVRNEGQRCPS
jgi:hypothetical protein